MLYLLKWWIFPWRTVNVTTRWYNDYNLNPRWINIDGLSQLIPGFRVYIVMDVINTCWNSFFQVYKMVTLWLCQNSYWKWPSRNSGFTHWKWWFFSSLCKRLPEGITSPNTLWMGPQDDDSHSCFMWTMHQLLAYPPMAKTLGRNH